MKCFVCDSGHVWTIDHQGKTNFRAEIKIDGERVLILGERDSTGDDGRLVEAEYVLWPTLTSLAVVLEQDKLSNADGSVSLEQAVAGAYKRINSFEVWWRKNHSIDPERYPMVLTENNAGLWDEQIYEHEEVQ